MASAPDVEAATNARRKLIGTRRTPRAHRTRMRPRSRAAPRTELEERVPWRQVKKSWNQRREAWLKQVQSTIDCRVLCKLLLMLETALKIEALSPTYVPPTCLHAALVLAVGTHQSGARSWQVGAESRELARARRSSGDSGAP